MSLYQTVFFVCEFSFLFHRFQKIGIEKVSDQQWSITFFTMETQQNLGPYVLVKHLGSGTTGKVKLAIHKESQNQYAIKIIRKEDFQDRPNLQTKIQREIALMRLVDHPHILKLVDFLESPRHLYIVLEYASKGELFDYLVEKKTLPEDVAIRFFRQIIYGLEYLHSLGICHRDLKPENILLDESLNVKIADFGFARFVKTNIAETSCGSPHYAAPEVIRGQPYDGRAADIWSCGVILYALLAVRLNNIPYLLEKRFVNLILSLWWFFNCFFVSCIYCDDGLTIKIHHFHH
ncbi:CAMK family protein kinase [Tritrichomonas foetus]|uniref:CAMK family protein kinase n=1 Tax=Tritrichomonas foetus TaxID=1144522 RepID=A0A1J4J5X0_9EUKA|nr:CAMK family protein kinase [Tritrichomonas foetus]|eukprot:OHS94057.1 CAMK family protein kinase [Tritrichomonas foetus]